MKSRSAYLYFLTLLFVSLRGMEFPQDPLFPELEVLEKPKELEELESVHSDNLVDNAAQPQRYRVFCFSPNGRYVISDDTNGICVRDANAQWQSRCSLPCDIATLNRQMISWSPYQYFVANLAGKTHIIDVDGNMIERLHRHNEVSTVSWSPKGNYIITDDHLSGEKNIYVWGITYKKVNDLTQIAAVAQSATLATSELLNMLAWNEDEDCALGLFSGAVILYGYGIHQRSKDRENIASMLGAPARSISVCGICFIPNKDHLAVSYSDQRIIIWNIVDKTIAAQYNTNAVMGPLGCSLDSFYIVAAKSEVDSAMNAVAKIMVFRLGEHCTFVNSQVYALTLTEKIYGITWVDWDKFCLETDIGLINWFIKDERHNVACD